jgi:uncharacterized protein YbaR (Trm112 family)
MVSKDLLEIMACPWCLGDLIEVGDALHCKRCRAEYPVLDGIPDMLVRDAKLFCPACHAPLQTNEGKAVCSACGLKYDITHRLEVVKT